MNTEQFIDGKGRSITIQSKESDNGLRVDAYGPENPNVPIGRLVSSIDYAGLTPHGLRINDVLIDPDYRGAGIGSELIERAEEYAQRHDLQEISGSVTDEPARVFWAGKADQGWELHKNENGRLIVRKSLAQQEQITQDQDNALAEAATEELSEQVTQDNAPTEAVAEQPNSMASDDTSPSQDDSEDYRYGYGS